MRILALDVGDRRTGVAISDLTGIIALPLPAVIHQQALDRLQAVIQLVDENNADEIVIGMPVSLSGQKGKQAKWVDRFVQQLREVLSVRVTTLDERYTTVEAENILKQAGFKPSKDRAKTDSVAAAILLQAYLDSKKFV